MSPFLPFDPLSLCTEGTGDPSCLTQGLSSPSPTLQVSSIESLGRPVQPASLLHGMSASQAAAVSAANAQDSAPLTLLGLGKDPVPPPPSVLDLTDAEVAQHESGRHVFSGSDMKVFLEIPGNKMRSLLEVSTVTVSVHREKAPVRALGCINTKGYARGRRTIAGTIILTQFQVDFLLRFLGTPNAKDESKDTRLVKVDQLPPFNLYLYFGDEYSKDTQSYRELIGVDLVTDGTVHSSQDMYTERTLSYVAADFTPLLPINAKANATPTDTRLANGEKTPKDAVSSVIKFENPDDYIF